MLLVAELPEASTSAKVLSGSKLAIDSTVAVFVGLFVPDISDNKTKSPVAGVTVGYFIARATRTIAG